MKIDYRTVAKNTGAGADGHTTVDSLAVFTDLPEDKEFLNSLTAEWKRIPPDLLGNTTSQNFICYARLPQD